MDYIFPPALYLNKYVSNDIKLYLNFIPEDTIIADNKTCIKFFNIILKILLNNYNFEYNPDTYIQSIESINLPTNFKNIANKYNLFNKSELENIEHNYINIFNLYLNNILSNNNIELRYNHILYFKKNNIFKTIFKSIINSKINIDIDFINFIENDSIISLFLLETIPNDINPNIDVFLFNSICSLPLTTQVSDIFKQHNDNKDVLIDYLSDFIFDLISNINFKEQLIKINNYFKELNSDNFKEFNLQNIKLNSFINIDNDMITNYNTNIKDETKKINIDSIKKYNDDTKEEFYKLSVDTFKLFTNSINNSSYFKNFENIPINRQILGDVFFSIWDNFNTYGIKNIDISILFDNEVFQKLNDFKKIKSYFSDLFINLDLINEFKNIDKINKFFIPSRIILWSNLDNLFCSKIHSSINKLCVNVDVKNIKYIDNYKFCVILKEFYNQYCNYPFPNTVESTNIRNLKESINKLDTNSLRIDDSESNKDLSNNNVSNVISRKITNFNDNNTDSNNELIDIQSNNNDDVDTISNDNYKKSEIDEPLINIDDSSIDINNNKISDDTNIDKNKIKDKGEIDEPLIEISDENKLELDDKPLIEISDEIKPELEKNNIEDNGKIDEPLIQIRDEIEKDLDVKNDNINKLDKNSKIGNKNINEVLLENKYIYLPQINNDLLINNFKIHELRGILIEGQMSENKKLKTDLSKLLETNIVYGKILKINSEKIKSNLEVQASPSNLEENNTHGIKREFDIELMEVNEKDSKNEKIFTISFDIIKNNESVIIDLVINFKSKIEIITKYYLNLILSILLINILNAIKLDNVNLYITLTSNENNIEDDKIFKSNINLLIIDDLKMYVKESKIPDDGTIFRKDDNDGDDLNYRKKYNITNIESESIEDNKYKLFYHFLADIQLMKQVFFKLFKKNKIKEINSDIIIQNTDNNIYEMDEDKFSKADDLDNNYIHDF